tara:strand:+ start:235 stop:1380 length:1146 start_codon:yes stop_codon:yes gene_type:complete
MATQELFNGHKYVFTKVSSSLVLDDSTDNSHETITFREGLVASASLNEHAVIVKSSGNYEGLQLISNTNSTQTAVLSSVTDDGHFKLLRTGNDAFKVDCYNSTTQTDFIYGKSSTNSSTRYIMRLYNSSNKGLFRLRSDGRLNYAGGDFYVSDTEANTDNIRLHVVSDAGYFDYNFGGDMHFRQGSTTRMRLDGSVIDKLGHLRPVTNNVYDVGSSTYRWDDIRATNGNIQTSDRNLKEHISGSNLGLSFINDLNPVSYRWLGKNRNHYGLIAQEVSESLARHDVNTNDFAGYIKDDIYHRTKQSFIPDNNDSGSYENEEDYQSVKEITNNPDLDISDYTYSSTTLGLRYAEFISPLIKAVQELSAEVTSLKAKVTELENN